MCTRTHYIGRVLVNNKLLAFAPQTNNAVFLSQSPHVLSSTINTLLSYQQRVVEEISFNNILLTTCGTACYYATVCLFNLKVC